MFLALFHIIYSPFLWLRCVVKQLLNEWAVCAPQGRTVGPLLFSLLISHIPFRIHTTSCLKVTWQLVAVLVMLWNVHFCSHLRILYLQNVWTFCILVLQTVLVFDTLHNHLLSLSSVLNTSALLWTGSGGLTPLLNALFLTVPFNSTLLQSQCECGCIAWSC